jgi:hypothetical protein
MGGDHRGDPLRLDDGSQQGHDGEPGLGVQLTGRLVRDQEARRPGQCPGDGDPLLLSTRELRRALPGVVAQTHELEQQLHPIVALGRRLAP